MGNSGSAADRALRACATNDLAGLQKIMDNMSAASPQRKLVVDAKDKEGRSCLIIATIKNFPRIMKLLLQNGADVHYINLAAAKCNTALHEAAARGYEEPVDLLLQYGANPFLANRMGETAMELAVLASSAKVVRTFEQQALFSGVAEFQWTKLLGLSLEFTPRRVVIMDHFPFPRGSAAAQAARRQMWIHTMEKDSIMPKCRVWLDGACAIRSTSGRECVLRLSHAHSQPVGKVYTRFVQGFCLFMRPAAGVAAGGGRDASWERLLRLCNVNDALYVAGVEPFFKGASGSAAAQGLLLARLAQPELPAPPTPPLAGAGSFAAGPHGRAASAMPAPPTPPAGPGSFAGAAPRSYPELVGGVLMMPAPHVAGAMTPRESFNWRAGAPAPPQSYPSSLAGTPPRPAPPPGRPSVDTRGVDFDHNSALPGESDAEFAARLAAMSSGGADSAIDMQALKMASTALAAALPSPHSAASASADAGSSSSYWPPPPPRHAASHPYLDAQPSAPPLAMPPQPQPQPQQPPPPPQSHQDDDSCVICLSAPREAGFLHGGTVHRCVCNDCSKIFQADMARDGAGEMPCPLCRQPVEQVITIF